MMEGCRDEKKTVEQRSRDVISSQFGLEDFSDNAMIKEDLGADSLDATELIMELEDEFDIDITDDEADKVKTVGDIIELIRKKVSDAGTG